jgi:hypothetical protein
MAAAALADDPVIVWEPQPGPQTALVTCPVFEVFYGGARGGGKTDGSLGEWLDHSHSYGDAANGVFFRRALTQLDEAIARSQEIYAPLGAKWQDQKKTWTFPNGARLKFRYLERDSDAEVYQGHSYTRLYFEELTNFPDPKPVRKLMATLRSAKGVPCGFRGTGNPGGPGHHWVKARYIDPAPLGYKVITDPETGLERVFIPAKVSDNRILTSNDPGYVARLKSSGSPDLVRAWLEGDWTVITGAFFPEFSAQHVLAPFSIPDDWTRFRAMDWGSARPFSVGWYAIAQDAHETPQGLIPRGALVKYREWYGASEPNVGLKLTAEEVADGILARERGDRIAYAVADPAAFSQDGGPSIIERMDRQGCKLWRRADNKRTAQLGALGGWDQLRARLKGEDGRPMIYFFATCVDTIRTLPALQHDETKPEDVDTEGEDHAGDETRYACMSRPYVRTVTEKKPDRHMYEGRNGMIVGNVSITEMIRRAERRAADE